ncbi:MAG: phytoene/squalene synthase family protein [Anaerolineae bacterium]
MNRPERSWERRLLAMAYEGLEEEPLPEALAVDPQTLDDAYVHCDNVAREHSRTFYMASGLLPASRRRAVRALYAFCRVTDDLIDRADGDLEVGLAEWRACVLVSPPPYDNPVALAWADTRHRYRIPTRYADQLVAGVAADLHKTRYANFDELAVYCYGVASTVGLMSMHIIGFSGREAIPYAVKLGVAMQVTNILRDVCEDWDAGRLYLPQDELAAHGLSEDDIAAGCVDGRWRAFMRFQIERNRQLYAEAMPGIAMLHPSGRYAIAAAAELYQAILADIEAHDGDVFTRRADVSTWGKLRRLLQTRWRVRNMRAITAGQVEERLQPSDMVHASF